MSNLFEAFEPLVALFLLDGQTMTKLLFPELLGISRPALCVEQSQRSPLSVKGHGIMNDQPNGTVRRGAYWAKIFRCGVSAVVKCCSILNRQHDCLSGAPLYRAFIVWFKDLFHARFRIVEKSIGGLGLGAGLTCLIPSRVRTRNVI